MTLDLTQYPEWLLTIFLVGIAFLIIFFTLLYCFRPRSPWKIKQGHRLRTKLNESGGWDLWEP